MTFKTLLLAGLASSALGVSAAHAQQVPQPTEDPETRSASSADSLDDGAIVVTGSLIARSELESVMPVSVTRFDDMARVGRLNAYDALRREPALAPGTGAYSANHADHEAGAAYINLRNLGTNRSLVLVDGRRRVSGNATTSAVDINLIPPAMIDRIEVVTGGAAAIYGADAVTGAVNIITKRAVDGLNVTAYQGLSEHGDAPETTVSLATGGRFAEGRGSFSVGGTYLKTGHVLHSDREFSRKNLTYWGNPRNTGPNDGIPDNITVRDTLFLYNSEVPAIYIPNNDTFYHYYNGQLSPTQYLEQFGTGEFSRGDGVTDPNVIRSYTWFNPLRLAEESYSAIAKFDYELTDGIRYGARLDYGNTRSGGQISRYREDSRSLFAHPHGGAVAYLDNPYMPESVRELLTSFGLTQANVDRFYSNWPLIETRQDRQSITIEQNLSGDIGNSLNWHAFYQYGRMTKDTLTPNIPRTSRWVAARDVIADPVTGAPVCRDEVAREAGCVPYDIFGNDPLTQEQRQWMLVDLQGRSIVKQEILGAHVNGRLFALPAGNISFAAGLEHRAESARVIPDALAADGDAQPGGFEGVIPRTPAHGSMKVTELFGELVVPILRDVPFFHRLDVEGAYRYSDYNTIGSTNTWKAGASWAPVDGLTIRGVRSRSVRVPNFGELYSPVGTSITGTVGDPCLLQNYHTNETRAANCRALGITTPLTPYANDVVVQGGGNMNLDPETSNSFTVGVVMQPRGIPGLDLVADYWNIDIEGVITSFSINQMMDQCVDLPSIDNVFCNNIERADDGRVTFISTQLVNASLMKAHGIDFGLNYNVPLGGGRINLGFKGSYLLQREIQTIPEVEAALIQYAGGYTDPRFRGSLLTSYSINDFNISLDTRFISAARIDPNAHDEYYDNDAVPSRVYNDIALSQRFGSRFEIGAGVKNVLNVKPPMLPALNVGGGGRYDTIGRYFFGRIGAKF